VRDPFAIVAQQGDGQPRALQDLSHQILGAGGQGGGKELEGAPGKAR